MDLGFRAVTADTCLVSERTGSEGRLPCDRCGEPATVISAIGRFCSKHAREEAERNPEAFHRRKPKGKPRRG